MRGDDFKAPYFAQEELWQRAEEFRTKVWPSGVPPIDILEVVEFELDLELRPIDGMRRDHDVDALLLANWQTVVVDSALLMDARYANRLRFSICHELGHFVLHRDVYESIPVGSAEDWVRFVQGIPDLQYSYIEYHANEFAGRALVPRDHLVRALNGALDRASAEGIERGALVEDSHLQYLATGIAPTFEVSAGVIERRLRREGLWPL